MDPIEKAIALFHSSIEARATLGEQLAPQLVEASELLVKTLVNDRHALLCGYGHGAITAQHMTTILLNQSDRERPGLPAIMLDGCLASMTSIAQSYGSTEIFARQIRAIGQQDDLLIVFTANGNPQSLINAVQAAHDRNMAVLLFNGNDRGHAAQLLDGDDIEISIPVSPDFFVHEMHLLLIYILCGLVDEHLFGGND